MSKIILAAEGRDYVTSIDTKQVSIGQANIVLAMARLLRENPELTVREAAAKAGSSSAPRGSALFQISWSISTPAGESATPPTSWAGGFCASIPA